MSDSPDTWNVDRAADVLLAAETDRTDREPVTDEWPGLDLATAYEVQDAILAKREAAGEKLVGVKLGFTSEAKQQRMGIDTPLTAWLTDAMMLPVGDPVPVAELIHPRIEPEIVVVLGEDLAGPGVTAEQALAAIDKVYAGLEVIDSRYTDFKFTLPDVVADNASSGRYVVSEFGCDPDELDLVDEECRLSVDGEVVARATGAAVQGNPAQALALAANSLAERGITMKAGWVVLTGGMTDAAPIERGTQVAVDFTTLGALTVNGAIED